MYGGFGNTGGMGGMGGTGANGANGIVNNIGNLIYNAQNTLQQNLTALNQQNNGVLDPLQMTNIQMLTQNYLAEVQTLTSVVKQIGDMDKTIATNIGS